MATRRVRPRLCVASDPPQSVTTPAFNASASPIQAPAINSSVADFFGMWDVRELERELMERGIKVVRTGSDRLIY